MNVAALFPEPVGIFELGRDLTKAEMGYINSLSKEKNQGNLRSQESYILNDKKLNRLKKFMMNSAVEFFNEIYKPEKKDLKLYMTQSWANYNEKGMYHHKHAHPGSLISGVFFAHADERYDTISFFNKRDYDPLQIKPNIFHAFNSDIWHMPANTGWLYIFKSSFTHSVNAVMTDDEEYKTRISISFNTFVKGTIGDRTSLTELILE